ncbi:MAG: c-type cytochrome [Gammaproteobacteria bacterium]|nr:c-type cytochrome [Gammaproteobacteria bacterium]MBU1415772.1 c-type cytochrome [Gammaproteobacteria bacterium]
MLAPALLPAGVSAREPELHRPPPLESAPQDKYGDLVRLGYAIVTDTPNKASRYSGNKLSCSNCHLDAGRKPNAAPYWAAFVAYPSWRSKTDRVDTFDERVQQCFRYSLDGIPPAFGSIELTAIAAYAHFLARGLAVGTETRGRGFPLIGKTGLDPNRDRGRVVYREHCQVCHGEDGGGQTGIPPLWGFGSYNKGAGMANVETAASFIKANMPLGKPVLTDQQALDVAAYMNAQLRPPDPRHGLLSIFR